ncbi:MAG: hypothetical protein JO148_03505 [Acidimicrobiia bacterium]|nr:hypothetical protein [Acidimicrobiia bacterium]
MHDSRSHSPPRRRPAPDLQRDQGSARWRAGPHRWAFRTGCAFLLWHVDGSNNAIDNAIDNSDNHAIDNSDDHAIDVVEQLKQLEHLLQQ